MKNNHTVINFSFNPALLEYRLYCVRSLLQRWLPTRSADWQPRTSGHDSVRRNPFPTQSFRPYIKYGVEVYLFRILYHALKHRAESIPHCVSDALTCCFRCLIQRDDRSMYHETHCLRAMEYTFLHPNSTAYSPEHIQVGLHAEFFQISKDTR